MSKSDRILTFHHQVKKKIIIKDYKSHTRNKNRLYILWLEALFSLRGIIAASQLSISKRFLL